MSLIYRMKLLVEILEDYKVGLEEHLYGGSGEREKFISPEHIRGEDENLPFIIQTYDLSKEEIFEIRNEIQRIRLFIDVFTKLLNEPLN